MSDLAIPACPGTGASKTGAPCLAKRSREPSLGRTRPKGIDLFRNSLNFSCTRSALLTSSAVVARGQSWAIAASGRLDPGGNASESFRIRASTMVAGCVTR